MNHIIRIHTLMLIATFSTAYVHCAIKDTVHTTWNKVTSTLSQTIAQHTTHEHTNCLHHVQQYKHCTLKIDQGSVTVSAWEKPHTVVQYTIKGSKKALHNTLCTEHKEGDSLSYDVSYRSNDEKSERAEIDFVIRIPFDCSLNCSLEEGSIKVKNTHAAAIVQTNKGFIKIKNCNGAIKATTLKGTITCKLYDLVANQDIRLNASSNIVIKMSPLAATKLIAHAPHGSITSDIAITLDKTTMLLNDEAWEERKHSINGSINNGNALLTAISQLGSITINSY